MCAEYSAESECTAKNGRSRGHPILRIRILLIARRGETIFFFEAGCPGKTFAPFVPLRFLGGIGGHVSLLLTLLLFLSLKQSF